MLNYKDDVEDESWRFDVEDEIVVLEDRELCGRLKPYHQGRKLLALNGFFFFLKFNSNISLDNPNKLREENSWL